MIPPEAAREAIALVRQSIAARLGVAPPPPPPSHPFLSQVQPVFVTLYRHPPGSDERFLHGCIGSLAGLPLAQGIRQSAEQAAFEDPRAAPLEPKHLGELEVEISLLSPFEPLVVQSEKEALERLRPHKDGLLLSHNPPKGKERRALFLPSVWEKLPKPIEFLRALKQKAGLPPDFWDEHITLKRFSTHSIRDPAPWTRPNGPGHRHLFA
ncbi:MAG: AmmeMemoRadiSam system protein A [Sandaracinaceae bacterium]|nr:AmmeMemoRadiSam system protein A [Sandaracinaceae bacterium]MDW8246840.1 AmmeMemoRadiSam system protein A [Sandaracinaceae bacterium]